MQATSQYKNEKSILSASCIWFHFKMNDEEPELFQLERRFFSF